MIFRSLLAIALAAILLILLFRVAEFDGASIGSRLSSLGLWWIVITATSFVQIALSAEKWRRVLKALSDGQSPAGFSFCLFFSAVAAVMSQFLTVYVASIGVRALAARTRYKIALGQGVASSGVEQIFDIAVLGIVFVPTAVSLLTGSGLGLWFVLAGLGLGAAIWAMSRSEAWLGRLADRGVGPGRMRAMLAGPGASKVLGKDTGLPLLGMSVIRYLAMFARVASIMVAAGFSFAMADLFIGFNTGQVSQIASVTPGNLGIFEWSWSGALALRGYSFEAAAELALVIRLASFASFIAVALLSGALFALSEMSARRSGEKQE